MAVPHTPGPWLVHEDGDANRYAILDADGRWLLTLLHNGQDLTERQRANLRLIAKAPLMLALLQRFTGWPHDSLHGAARADYEEVAKLLDELAT